MDSASELFTGKKAKPANELERGIYKAPYVVPEKV